MERTKTHDSHYASSLIEASLDPLIAISIDGKITDMNQAKVNITGIKRETLIGTNFFDYFTEPQKAKEVYEDVFDKGFITDSPLTFRHKNGKLTDVLFNGSVYKDEKGIVRGAVVVARDIAEQKWAVELRIANKELAFQNNEKEKRAEELLIANKELVFQNNEKEKRAEELLIANKELAYQNEEKEKRAAELIIANKELVFQNEEKEKRAAELIIADKELVFQTREKEKRASELIIADKELDYQNEEKEKRASELIIADKELDYQSEEKGKRAAELIIANKELVFQNEEKEKRAAELIIANKELDFQNDEKEKRAEELIIANKELVFQNDEKEKRAAELIIANKELVFQNEEKEKRAEELIIANKELVFQNEEKEKRAEELIIANKELVFQNEEKEKRAEEKEKRAAELIIANKELAFQNEEKEKRAAELILANKELVFQNEEKEKRAAELVIADKELAFQNEEKAKRAAELVIADKELIIQNEEKEKQEAANKELEAFSYSISHDLRAPLRHIGGFVDLLIKNNSSQLDETGLRYLNTVSESTIEMGNLIDALLTFSRLSRTELQRTQINVKNMVARVIKTFSAELTDRNVEINISELPNVMGDESLIFQVWVNLISNAFKYSRNKEKSVIDIGSEVLVDKTIFYVKDNGVGFDMKYSDKLFGVFQRLHKARDFEGIGIGLANVNRIVMRHGGTCWVESAVGKGATFFFSIPNNY